jgi:hypothetical protein
MRWRLRRLLEDHDRNEADIAARDGEPPPLTDDQADRMWLLVRDRMREIIRKDGEPK